MYLPALILVLASACLHALWNALLKRARDLPSTALGILGVTVVVTGGLLPFIPGPAFPGPGSLRWALAAGVGEGFYFVSLTLALRSSPLGWSYAWMRGLGMLLVWPVSLAFLGETLRPLAGLSVTVVCLGLVCLGLIAGTGRHALAGKAGPTRSLRPVAWACAAGVCIAGYTLCYKASLGAGANPVGLYFVAMVVALPVQAALRFRRDGHQACLRLPDQWGLVLVGGILCAASFLSYLQALSLQGAGLMATLRNTSIVFAVLFSTLIGERPTLRQWTGAALVTAGAVGLAWPK